MKTAFIGHRKIFENIEERLTNVILSEIERGRKEFIMGAHGEFDNLTLRICKRLKNIYKDLEIEVVITNLSVINKDREWYNMFYSDVQTVTYDIEDVHYKQRITLSNKKMIDESDTLICYVDTAKYKSGAKTALRYAEKQGLKIINLYFSDKPFW